MSELLLAIKLMNTVLAFGTTGLPIAKHIGQMMENAQENGGGRFTKDERDELLDMADQVDTVIADALRQGAPG